MCCVTTCIDFGFIYYLLLCVFLFGDLVHRERKGRTLSALLLLMTHVSSQR